MVNMNSKIVNNGFPDYEEEIKKLAKKLDFQPTLDYLFNQYSKDENQDLAKEVTDLYMNLSENQND